MENVKVGIALLNWNQYDDAVRCLAALRQSAFRPAIILVFDNGSTDGSAERLQAEYPEIRLALGGQNLGFAEANNRAAKMLLEAGMDLVWILNSDTQVEPDCLGTLAQALEADPGVGAASAKIWFMDERKPICYAGATFNRWTFMTRFRGLREPDAGQYDTAGDTEILTGCCMLIRADVLRRIGLFQPTLFAYSEDADWSLRARAAGFRLRYVPQATLWHKMYGSSVNAHGVAVPKSSPQVQFLLTRNRFILIRLHTRPWSLRRGFALSYPFLVCSLPRALGLLLRRDRRAAGVAIFKGLWAGLAARANPGDCRL